MDDFPNFEDEKARKAALARLVASIEGVSDEDLHAMFVARAVKKAIWDENDLRAAIQRADKELGWGARVKRDIETGWEELLQDVGKGEDVDFDDLFRKVGEGA